MSRSLFGLTAVKLALSILTDQLSPTNFELLLASVKPAQGPDSRSDRRAPLNDAASHHPAAVTLRAAAHGAEYPPGQAGHPG